LNINIILLNIFKLGICYNGECICDLDFEGLGCEKYNPTVCPDNCN
jgi:hypothetical protein